MSRMGVTDKEYFRLLNEISKWPDWKLDEMCLSTADLKVKQIILNYRENKNKLGKWISFFQEGMEDTKGNLIVLHGLVIKVTPEYVIVKCKNGNKRTVPNIMVINTFNNKEECYNQKRVTPNNSQKIKYMRCEHCNKILRKGVEIIEDGSCIGAYCSIECWAKEKGNFKKTVLTDSLVLDSWGLKCWDSELENKEKED